MVSFTLNILDIVKTVPDVVQIVFKQPALKKVKYKAGQYITIKATVNGRKYLRPYSLSSAPGIDPHLEVTLKRIPGGVVSNYIYDHLTIGDLVEVIEPMGDFTFQVNDYLGVDCIMLWGAGTGITPLMSIIKTVLNVSQSINVELFYCNRDPNHTIFHDELSELQNKFPERLKVHYFFTKIPEDIYLNYHIKGRIDQKKINTILAAHQNLVNTYHYICGPVGLKETVKHALSELNVPSQNVYTEEFEVLIDPKEFNDIETQIVTIIRGNETKKIEVIKGKSILDAGLDNDFELSYSCQTGTCKLCKGKLIIGTVKVIGVDKMPDGLEPDDCLLCCSYPQTGDVEIMVD